MPLVLVSLGECHTEAPHIIARRSTAVHDCRALLSEAPHVEAATLVRAIVYATIFTWNFLVWGPYLSLPLIHRLKTSSSALGET